jgi:hydrogenase maturation factor HypF (carbamoyltransferase family)
MNEILKESKIQKIKLSGYIFQNKILDNKITEKGLEIMKDALINNEYLDEIDLSCKYF